MYRLCRVVYFYCISKNTQPYFWGENQFTHCCVDPQIKGPLKVVARQRRANALRRRAPSTAAIQQGS